MTPQTPEQVAEKITTCWLNHAYAKREDIAEWLKGAIAQAIREYGDKAAKNERSYWQEFMRLNKFEDQSQTRLEGIVQGQELMQEKAALEAERVFPYDTERITARDIARR